MNYWAMPSVVQKVINFFVPTKTQWNIDATKTDMGDWVFDIKPFVKDEAICGGSEFILDAYYIHTQGQPPNVGDTINLSLSVDKPAHYHAVCKDFKKDAAGFGHTYIEQNTQMEGWFCPMFDVMFGFIPNQLYITFN
jgi:hypothetical protein